MKQKISLKGLIGLMLIILPMIGIVLGVYEFKIIMETNNYSLFSYPNVDSTNGGFFVLISGIIVWTFSLLAVAGVVFIFLGFILLLCLYIIYIGFNITESELGEKMTLILAYIVTFVFSVIIVALLSSLVFGEMQAAMEGRI